MLSEEVDCFFFFQAEDGIRDGHVTGVQTCALPISRSCYARSPHPRRRTTGSMPARLLTVCVATSCPSATWIRRRFGRGGEIGRASCRERVWSAVGAGGVTKNVSVRERRRGRRRGRE